MKYFNVECNIFRELRRLIERPWRNHKNAFNFAINNNDKSHLAIHMVPDCLKYTISTTYTTTLIFINLHAIDDGEMLFSGQFRFMM